MKIYVSLVKDFLGYYLKFEVGEDKRFKDENAVREYVDKLYHIWWCSTYSELPKIDSPYVPPPKIITLKEFEARIASSDGLYEYTRLTNEINEGKWKRNAE